MTNPEMFDPLLDKLKRITGAQMRSAGLEHEELMRLISLLEEDALPLDAKERGGYRVTTPCIGQHERSVMGPGLGQSYTPLLPSEFTAEVTCRCLSQAYAAGQRNRSAALMALLGDK